MHGTTFFWAIPTFVTVVCLSTSLSIYVTAYIDGKGSEQLKEKVLRIARLATMVAWLFYYTCIAIAGKVEFV